MMKRTLLRIPEEGTPNLCHGKVRSFFTFEVFGDFIVVFLDPVFRKMLLHGSDVHAYVLEDIPDVSEFLELPGRVVVDGKQFENHKYHLNNSG